jgi:hypothetical protein
MESGAGNVVSRFRRFSLAGTKYEPSFSRAVIHFASHPLFDILLLGLVENESLVRDNRSRVFDILNDISELKEKNWRVLGRVL